MKFVGLIESAVRQHTADHHSYYSTFFVPWRFNLSTPIIELEAEPASAAPTSSP